MAAAQAGVSADIVSNWIAICVEMADNNASDIEAVFCDAEESGSAAVGSEKHPMRRRSSVPELFRVMKEKEQRKSKKHKRDSKEDENEEGPSHVCRLAGESLETVKQIMVTEVAKVLSLMERKFEAQEKRIEILEAELMQSENDKKVLHAKLTAQEKAIRNLTEQFEYMDTNRRMNSLILKSQGFGKRSINENIEEKVVNVLNQRFPDLAITASDLQTVHRLQGEHTVICKFLKTQLRNEVFERRMSQAGYIRGSGNSVAPLYTGCPRNNEASLLPSCDPSGAPNETSEASHERGWTQVLYYHVCDSASVE